LKNGLDQFKGNKLEKAYALFDTVNNDTAVLEYENRDRIKGKKIDNQLRENMITYYIRLGGTREEIINSYDTERIKRTIEGLRKKLLRELEAEFPNITKHQTPKDKRHSNALKKAGTLKGKVSAEDYMRSIMGGGPRTPGNKRDSTATVIGAYTPGTTPGTGSFATPKTSEITAGGKRAFTDALNYSVDKGSSQVRPSKIITASGNKPRVDNRKLGGGVTPLLKKANNDFLTNPAFDPLSFSSL
jgi:hypothetical protein